MKKNITPFTSQSNTNINKEDDSSNLLFDKSFVESIKKNNYCFLSEEPSEASLLNVINFAKSIEVVKSKNYFWISNPN